MNGYLPKGWTWEQYRGLFWRRPYLTAVLTVMMLSLAGIPLTAGFIGKFYIVATGVEAHEWWLVASLVLGSAIGVFYYLRVMVTLYLIEPNLRRVDAELHWEQKAGTADCSARPCCRSREPCWCC